MLLRPDATDWLAAEDKEITGLFEMGVFEVTEKCLRDKFPIGLKMVYDLKLDGTKKARLVAQGFTQQPEDYGNVHAPVTRMVSYRIVMAWTAKMNLELFSFDVKQAFLNAPLVEEIYVKQIPGRPIPNSPSAVYRLRRALYGLHQASAAWYSTLCNALEELGFTRCECDNAVFIGRWTIPPDSSIPMPENSDPLVMFIPVHVDDGLVSTNSSKLYSWFIKSINLRFKVIDLGPTSTFLGIRIYRDRTLRLLWLSQENYVTELLEQYGLLECVSHDLPLCYKFDGSESTTSVYDDVDSESLTKIYQALVGCLLFLALCTQPDIAYSVMFLAQFNSKPSPRHLIAAKGTLRYLAKTRSWALQYGGAHRDDLIKTLGIDSDMMALSDADWGSNSIDQKSILGFGIFLFGGLVAWSASKQKSIALSSTEAEYMGLTHVLKELLWIRVFTSLIQLPIPHPFPLISDNRSSIDIANSRSVSNRSKHIDIRYHFIRSHIEDDSITTIWCSSLDMIADIFTKSLPTDLHYKHSLSLGLIPLPDIP